MMEQTFNSMNGQKEFLLPQDLLLQIVLIVFLLFHNYILVQVYRPTSALAQWITTVVMNYNYCYYLESCCIRGALHTNCGNLFPAKRETKTCIVMLNSLEKFCIENSHLISCDKSFGGFTEIIRIVYMEVFVPSIFVQILLVNKSSIFLVFLCSHCNN